jgi:hypothetical protein
MLKLVGGVDYPAAMAWGGHLLAAVLAGLGVMRWQGFAGLSQRWTWWVLAWTLLLPGAGWLFAGILVLGGWDAIDPREAAGEGDELVTPFGADLSRPVEAPSARIVREMDFVPLVEILAGDDMNLKRGAVEQLTRLRTPEAIAVLMSHRSDPSMEMRFYINSSLARIKKELDESLDAARYQMHMESDSVAGRLNLAKVYLLYAQSGLLDADLVNAYGKEAILHLNFVLDSGAPTPEAAELLITRLLQERDWFMAEASIRKARELALISDIAAAEYQAEMLFAEGQFGKVADVLRPFFGASSLSPDWKTTLLWWGAGT